MTLDDLKQQHWPVVVALEMDPAHKPIIAAWCPDFLGCIAQGDSVNEAIEGLTEMLPLFWARLLEGGGLKADEECPKPSPGPSITMTEMHSHADGKLTAEWRWGTIRVEGR